MSERTKVNNAAETRDGIIEWLRRELVGPAPGHPVVQLNGEEILRPQDPPRYRYACGILFPNGVAYSGSEGAAAEEREAIEDAPAIDAAEQAVAAGVADPDTDRADEAESDPTDAAPGTEAASEDDAETSTASLFLPSTMGLSFLADVSGGLEITASWATYAQVEVDGYPRSRDGKPARLWFRYPKEFPLNLAKQDLLQSRDRKTISGADSQGVLVLDIVSRPWKDTQLRLITVTLVNASASAQPINENSFFQCGLIVRSSHGSAIVAYPDRPDGNRDREELSMALLYRHRPVYAVGHGCAADWEAKDGVVQSVRTDVLPVFRQAPILARPRIKGLDLSMLRLARESKDKVVATCRDLLSAYRAWIADRESDLSTDRTISSELTGAGREHLDRCKGCADRIETGIKILASDARSLRAFQLMNQSMVEQREHYDLSSDSEKRRAWKKGESGQEPAIPYVAPAYTNETV